MPGSFAEAGRVRRRSVRSGARVVRVGDQVAFVIFDLWCAGAITVPVPVAVLQRVLGLPHGRLAGVRASVVINPGAVLDHEVQPRAWRPAIPASRGRELPRGKAAGLPGGPTGSSGAGCAGPAWIPAPRTRGSRP